MWRVPLLSWAVTLTNCPSWPLSESWLSTLYTLWPAVDTTTSFWPASAHFFVQSAWAELSPLAAHLSSLTHPLIVSSSAIAADDRNATAKITAMNLFMFDSSPRSDCRSGKGGHSFALTRQFMWLERRVYMRRDQKSLR